MAKTTRLQRTTALAVSPLNAAAGAEGSVLFQALEESSQRRNARLDQAAEQAGLQAGLVAGSEEEEATGSESTIRGRAFNRGVIASHQAALQTDIRDNVAGFELENEDNPEAFDAQVEGLLDGLLSEADPRLQPFIKQRAADYAGRAKTRILGRQMDKLAAEAQADLERGVDGMVDDATTGAFEGDILIVEARRQELNALLDGAVEGEITDEDAANDMRAAFEKDVTEQEIVGNFDRLVRSQGTDAGADAIVRWQKVKPSSVGMTPEDHEAVTRQLVARRNRELSLQGDDSARVNAEARAEHNARTGRISDAISVLKDGFPLDENQSKQVADDITALQSTGEADDLQRAGELAEDFDVANAIQEQVHRFRRMTAADRATELTRLERALREGAGVEEIELLKALQKTSNDVNRQLESDPRGYLQGEGLVDDPPLNFEGAEELVASLSARETEVGQQLAGQPIGILTSAEANQLAQVYGQAEVEERVALLGVITAGSGDAAEATLQQLDSNGHAQMALLGSYVMEGRGVLARDIMRGESILGADSGIKPKRADFQAIVDDLWGGAMSDWPEQRAIFMDAAFAKYAELKSRTGDLSDIYDPLAMQKALREVMPTARFNGRMVAVPAGVSHGAFNDWTDSWVEDTFAQFISGETLMAAPGVTAEEMLELVHDEGRLVELGNGRYGVTILSAASGLDRPVQNEDGTPFMLQFPRSER